VGIAVTLQASALGFGRIHALLPGADTARERGNRNIAAKLLVLCLIDFAHPAFADLTDDLIMAEGLADRE
jgi:hypothetical protein